MAAILGSRVRSDGKIIFEILADEEESKSLEGNITNIRLFSEQKIKGITKISGRGANESTKYFLIPKKEREDIYSGQSADYQVLKFGTKKIYIFIVSDF